MDGLIAALAPSDAAHFPLVLGAYIATFVMIRLFGGRAWSFVYVLLIPFVNWSFTWAPNLAVPGLAEVFFNPVTIVTGLVLVVRDFAQREIGHRILVVMAVAVAWSAYYAGPELALASGAAFAISELVDWALFTFTKYRLSTRVMLSSLIAAPLDTTIFLYGAELIREGMLTPPNWVMSVIGKLAGAAAISAVVRAQEDKELAKAS
ncbi:MAG: hypothetical protein AAF719_06330 [Pseudomonadota bacterium]